MIYDKIRKIPFLFPNPFKDKRFTMKETDRLLQDLKAQLLFIQGSIPQVGKIENLLKQILKELREIKNELGKK